MIYSKCKLVLKWLYLLIFMILHQIFHKLRKRDSFNSGQKLTAIKKLLKFSYKVDPCVQSSPFSSSVSSCVVVISRSVCCSLRDFSMSPSESEATMMAPRASHTTLMVVRKRSLRSEIVVVAFQTYSQRPRYYLYI